MNHDKLTSYQESLNTVRKGSLISEEVADRILDV